MAINIIAVIGGAIAVQGLIQGLLYTFPPWISGRAQQTYPTLPNIIPSIDMLVSMRYKNIIGEGTYRAEALKLGFETHWSDDIWNTSRRMLDGDQYIRLWRRGEIDEGELETYLKGIHIDTNDIQRFKKVSEFFPQAQDLVRFAIREVYTDAIRDKFGMDEDRPDKFLTEAWKAGVPPEQAKNFWAAHWDLPGVSQVFEMLHRKVITQEELAMVLKALDIMPFWRDKLQKIAYKPYTRVDTRRMHKAGVLEPEQLVEVYEAQGYDKEHAENMAEFTIRYNADAVTGLTRANIIKAFKQGLLDIDELKDFLESFGYNKDVITLWLRIAEYEKAIDLVEAKKSDLAEQYRMGAITEDEFRRQLGYGGVPSTYVETAVTTVRSEQAKKIKMPTASNLQVWLKLGIIVDDQYASYMRELGYRQADVERYLEEIAKEMDVSDRKYLPIKTYQGWLSKGIIEEERFIEIATGMKLSAEDIALLILELQETPSGD